MARIVYGVCGEGHGHALRSQAVIEHLKAAGHELLILASNKAYRVYQDLFDNLHEIHGFKVVYENNEVKSFSSVLDNLSSLPKGAAESIRKIRKLFQNFSPQLCITDFEPYTSYLAQNRGIPCLAIDNISIVDKAHIEHNRDYGDLLIAKAIAGFMVPFARDYLIPTFFYPEVTAKRVRLVQPVFRKEIIKAKREWGNGSKSRPGEGEGNRHVLVYQTSDSNANLLDQLKAVDKRFYIYGFDKAKEEENLLFRPFSQEQMVEDLANADAVITNGGFTLMSEAIYLGKPVLAEPVGKQFEQHVNSFYLDKLGIGAYTERMSLSVLLFFLSRLDLFRSRLSLMRFDDNRSFMRLVDEKIAEYLSGE